MVEGISASGTSFTMERYHLQYLPVTDGTLHFLSLGKWDDDGLEIRSQDWNGGLCCPSCLRASVKYQAAHLVARIQTELSQLCLSHDSTWADRGHLCSFDIIHFFNRSLYIGWCKLSELVKITCEVWWITMGATRIQLMSVFRLDSESKATQVLKSFKVKRIQIT